MKVLVVTPNLYDTAPGARFRIEQWARYLQKDGVEFTFAPFENAALNRVLYQRGQTVNKVGLVFRAFARRMKLVRTVKNYDLVYLYREAAVLGPAFIERMIARQGVPLLYDFDDPIWLPYTSPTNPAFSKLKWQSKVQEICALASTVIVGNRLLAEWASQRNPSVEIVPSTIDLQQYPLVEREAHPLVTLGWTGSHSTLPFLESIQPVLKKLAQEQPFRLVVISHTGAFKMDIAPAQLVALKWNAATEAADLNALDIGLAPFPNTGWTPWRCHGKVLQYMASAIPTVASNIGILPDYIEDGVSGMLATTDEAWLTHLTALMECPERRIEMGRAARRTVEEKYSAQVQAPRIREFLERTLSIPNH